MSSDSDNLIIFKEANLQKYKVAITEVKVKKTILTSNGFS